MTINKLRLAINMAVYIHASGDVYMSTTILWVPRCVPNRNYSGTRGAKLAWEGLRSSSQSHMKNDYQCKQLQMASQLSSGCSGYSLTAENSICLYLVVFSTLRTTSWTPLSVRRRCTGQSSCSTWALCPRSPMLSSPVSTPSSSLEGNLSDLVTPLAYFLIQ